MQKGQNKGIKFIEPNDNLCKDYLQSAEETLLVLRDIENKSRIWLATTKYYFEYFTFYALLMKLGIKCEIHDCTLLLCKLLEEKNIIHKGTYKMLEDDKELRTDNQYYLKNREVKINYSELTDFILNIKSIINSLTKEKIEKIRKQLD